MATPSIAIASPEPLQKKGNLVDNWRRWQQNFNIFLGAAGVEQTEPKACLLFLHNIGQYGRDIFNELGLSEPYNLDEFYIKFDEYCNPKRNITFDRYHFFNTKQENNQSFDKFLSLLKQRSINCEFGELNDSLMMTQIIIGTSNTALRRSLLTMADATLEDVIRECKSSEVASLQAQKIEVATTVGAVKKQPKKNININADLVEQVARKLQSNLQMETKKEKVISNKEKKDKPAIITNCKFCSNNHKYGECPAKSKDNTEFAFICKFCGNSHKKNNCPAFGGTCHKCKKPNHFAKMCKT